METTSIDYPRGITFEMVWAALMETRERQEKQFEEFKQERIERQKDFDLKMEERRKEMEERRKESEREWKEIRENQKRMDKHFGDLSNRFGDIVEHMVIPCALDKFSELGFEFEKAYHKASIKDKNRKTIAEADITLENGDKVMIIEVKTKPTIEDINDHVERMGKIRAHADSHNDKRIFLGAIAGVVISGSEKIYALKNGFYVLEPAGETFNITAPEGIYSPREW